MHPEISKPGQLVQKFLENLEIVEFQKSKPLLTEISGMESF